MVLLYNGIFGFLGAVISVIVVLSVANTVMMSAFERTREIGTLMAIGTERFRYLADFPARRIIYEAFSADWRGSRSAV